MKPATSARMNLTQPAEVQAAREAAMKPATSAGMNAVKAAQAYLSALEPQ